MEFGSLEFLAFLVISLLLFHSIKAGYRWIVLLVASLAFIYSFSLKFLLFTLLFSVFNWLAGILIAGTGKDRLKALYYQMGVWINIGLLVFFKYTGFILENLFALAGKTLQPEGTFLEKLIIPLGISFYTFQSIGYLIDVNRGTREPERNIGRFILFITYFPKFISGPVERSGNLLPQISKDLPWDGRLFHDGILQALWGFIKTVIISDRLVLLVNSVNANIDSTPQSLLILNFFVQFLYLYFNFSGYTDIVLGISKLFGVNLLPNFNRPLFATGVSDYWRRWHMSLTTWCNDYIFRRTILKRMKWKKWASVYAVFLTFLIIGIWHGANWNFVILGLLQGIAINYEYFTKKTRLAIGGKLPVWLNLSLSRLFTFIFICISHVFFYTSGLRESLAYFANMFGGTGAAVTGVNTGLTGRDMIIAGAGMLMVFISEYRDERGRKPVKEVLMNNKWLYWLVAASAVALLLSLGVKSSGFVYEQF